MTDSTLDLVLEGKPVVKNRPFYYNLHTSVSLAKRELMRLFASPARIGGVVAQPLLFWFVLGSGFASTFKLPGAVSLSYQAYFYPGVLALVLLFSAIFSTITLIDDKEAGLLQTYMAGPGSRTALVFGKLTGVVLISLLQMSLFLVFLPLAGVNIAGINWFLFASSAFLGAWGLAGLGFIFAWGTSSSSAYHALMSMVLIPMWILSGAIFPLHATWMQIVSKLNPMAWLVQNMQCSVNGLCGYGFLYWTALLAFAVAATWVSVLLCERKN